MLEMVQSWKTTKHVVFFTKVSPSDLVLSEGGGSFFTEVSPVDLVLSGGAVHGVVR